jgi:hypothetical protein
MLQRKAAVIVNSVVPRNPSFIKVCHVSYLQLDTLYSYSSLSSIANLFWLQSNFYQVQRISSSRWTVIQNGFILLRQGLGPLNSSLHLVLGLPTSLCPSSLWFKNIFWELHVFPSILKIWILIVLLVALSTCYFTSVCVNINFVSCGT